MFKHSGAGLVARRGFGRRVARPVRSGTVNLVQSPNNLGVAPWGGNAVASLDGSVLTLAGESSTLVNDNSAISNMSRAQAIAVPDDTVTHRYMIDVKPNTSDIVMIGLAHTGGTAAQGFQLFDVTDGSSISFSGLPPDAFGSIALADGWRRLWIEVANNGSGNTNMNITLYPAPRGDVASGSLIAATLGTVNATNAQVFVK